MINLRFFARQCFCSVWIYEDMEHSRTFGWY